jgi:hypothetical protein
MKHLAAILLLLSCFSTRAQRGNDWIDYSRQHFYFKIWQDGLYRIDYATMQSAGVPVGAIAPQDFKVFGKERELYIHVEDGADGTFGPGDYLEFYAQRNDGWLDSMMYQNPADIGNPAYSIINDTLTYYLTWDATTVNRRMVQETDVSFGSYAQTPWLWSRIIQYFSDQYLQGFKMSGLSGSFYERAEGWFGGGANAYASNASDRYTDVTLATPEAFSGGPDASVYSISASYSDATSGSPNHHLRLQHQISGNYQTVIDTIFSGYQQNNLFFDIPNAQIEPTSRIRFQLVNDLGVATDYQAVSYVQLDYPRSTNLSGANVFEFYLDDHASQAKNYLQFSNYGGSNPILITLSDQVRRIPVVNTSGTLQAIIPNSVSGTRQRCLLVDNTQVQNISLLKPLEFLDYSAIQLDSAFIIITHPSLMSSARTYATYRASPAGYSRDTLVVDVNQLYHQFGGGVYKHGIAIRRFMAHLIDAWPTDPAHLFLFGKSIRDATDGGGNSGKGTRKLQQWFDDNLVPTYGYPPCDNCITAGLNGTVYQTAVPTGRLAVRDNATALQYLNKIIAYEAQQANAIYDSPNKDWMKQILHFAGGANQGEQVLFQYYLNTFADIAEDTSFGGDAHLFAKTSSAPIDPVEFSDVQGFLEDGVAMMTFFGHAAVNGFDQNLDAPSNWNNQDKYPFVLGNSCYTGDVHTPDGYSTSEEFTLIPNRGSIGFLASNKVGFSNGLYSFSYELYKQLFQKQYGQSISYCMSKAVEELQSQGAQMLGHTHTTTYQMMTLHGDPSIMLYHHPEPEYEIVPSSIITEPTNITLAVDTLDLGVIIKNLGRAVNRQIRVEITRYYPNGDQDTLEQLGPAIHYLDTIWFRVPVNHNIAAGINQFHVKVDIPSFVAETFDESGNNQLVHNLPLFFDGILPVWPHNFAIVPDDTIVFKASTVNPFASAKNYRFEVDTTDFLEPASPMRRYQIVNSPGGVVEAFPNDWLDLASGMPAPLLLTDSTVYFWRVALDTVNPVWTEYSFQYIPGQHGWGQAHFLQFKSDAYNRVIYDLPARRFEFGDSYRILTAECYDHADDIYDYYYTQWGISGNVEEYSMCFTTPAMHVVVIDPITLQPWETNFNGNHPQWDFGNDLTCTNSRQRSEGWFIFRQDVPAQLDSLEDMLLNDIPCGYYVMVFTAGYPDYDVWAVTNPTLDDVFQNLGASQVNTSSPELAWMLAWRQCDPDTNNLVQVYAQNIGDTLNILDTLYAFDVNGFITAPVAGPAIAWHSLHWQQHGLDPLATDSSRITLFGIRPDGMQVLLLDTLMSHRDSVLDLPNSIGLNAATYPWVQLQAYLQDSVFFTPAQIDRWQLLYTPVPEAALNAQHGYFLSIQNDTLPEGELARFSIAIENISDLPMDSLLVHYWLEDQDRNRNYIPYVRQDSLLPGEILLDTITFETEYFAGFNSIWIEVNPYLNGIKDQPEQHHFNNLAERSFYAVGDDVNPILDVTFDGLHILDGELVSARPTILITLKDNNPFMVMDEAEDTAHFQIWLTGPDNVIQRVWFNPGGQEQLRFFPAASVSEKFRIEFPAVLTQDGMYELFVQATDKSGNKSGDMDFRINFEVINKSTITEVLNYPNPFSTSTRFVFTLTGAYVPDEMEIQIFTVTGKMVKQIWMEELGPLRVGRNITEYAWDGTDEFGDKLANGVYLYRVVTRLNEENIEYNPTEAQKFFTKGVGKMYLMR